MTSPVSSVIAKQPTGEEIVPPSTGESKEMINAKAKESSDKDAASSVSSVTTVAAKASMESKKGAVEKSKTSVSREAKQGDITSHHIFWLISSYSY